MPPNSPLGCQMSIAEREGAVTPPQCILNVFSVFSPQSFVCSPKSLFLLLLAQDLGRVFPIPGLKLRIHFCINLPIVILQHFSYSHII